VSSLQKKAISSIKWTTLKTIILGIIGPLTLLVKARFLSPEEFAYVAIITIIIGLFHLLESFGISQAVIQRDSISRKESSSLFFFNIFFCILLAGILVLISPFIASFFDLPKLEVYLPIVSIIVLLTGPSLLIRAYLEKNLYFKQLSLIAILRNILTLISLTFFLFFGFGVKSVIFGHIVGSVFALLSTIYISIIYKTFKLSVYFNFKSIFPFIHFGFFVSSKQLLTYIAHHLDEVVVGYFLTPEILGIYHFGKNMMEKVRALITKSFGKVLFPVLSKLKNNIEKLSEAYQKVSNYIAFGAFPVFTGIAVTAHLFIPVVFGEQWTDSVIVFQVFSVSMLFLVLTANVSSSLLYSVNKPALVFYIDVFTNLIYFVTLMIVASYGMIAILISYSSYVIYKTIVLQYFANKQLTKGLKSYLKGLFKPLLICGFMGLFVILFQFLASPQMEAKALLILSILIGIIIFVILSLVMAKNIINELKDAFLKGKVSQ